MKHILVGRIVFYFVFFVLFFFLTVSSLENHGGWNVLALLNAAIAAVDFVRGVRLSAFYLQMRNKNKS